MHISGKQGVRRLPRQQMVKPQELQQRGKVNYLLLRAGGTETGNTNLSMEFSCSCLTSSWDDLKCFLEKYVFATTLAHHKYHANLQIYRKRNYVL